MLIGSRGTSHTESEDVFGNQNIMDTTDEYHIIAGKAVLTKSTTIIETMNFDGSTSKTIKVIDYIYDNYGFLMGAKGYSDTEGNDIFGTTFITHTDDSYIIIRPFFQLRGVPIH